MNANLTQRGSPVYLSLAVFAWNEEDAIGSTLQSLFEQSIFSHLAERELTCEIICVGNGCTDRTAEVAAGIFERQMLHHPARSAFRCRVINLPVRGKLNAWNQFVHSLSAKDAAFLFMLDADIRIHRPDTLRNMLQTLEQHHEASIAVDRPCKDIAFNRRKSMRDRLSLSAAQITTNSPAQLCAQLYGIRTWVARNIYLPKDLAACEDGFIKALACTDFLSHPVRTERIRLAPDAEHTFEAYTSLGAILKNQKRQIIGQTIVHILVDQYLPSLPLSRRLELGETLKDHERRDPSWLKRLISRHLQRVRFGWQLYPNLLSHRVARLKALPPIKRMLCAPSALAGLAATFVASLMAYRFLRQGSTDYWPRADRARLKQTASALPIALELTNQNPK